MDISTGLYMAVTVSCIYRKCKLSCSQSSFVALAMVSDVSQNGFHDSDDGGTTCGSCACVQITP